MCLFQQCPVSLSMAHSISCVLFMSTSSSGQLLTSAGDHLGELKVQFIDLIRFSGLTIIDCIQHLVYCDVFLAYGGQRKRQSVKKFSIKVLCTLLFMITVKNHKQM